MNTYTALIIDDEKPARDLIRNFLKAFDQIEVIGEASNGFEGCLLINEKKPDLLFLDVQMPKLTGLEMLEIVEEPLPFIIFSTAYDQYAVEAFEKNAVDYLLKPFSKERFHRAINRFLISIQKKGTARNQKDIRNLVRSDKYLERIPVRSGSKILVLSVGKIKYFKAEDDYVRLVSSEGSYLKQVTMTNLEKSLSPDSFVRIHRSYILNITCLKQLEKYDNTSYTVVTNDNEILPVSRSGLANLNELLGLG